MEVGKGSWSLNGSLLAATPPPAAATATPATSGTASQAATEQRKKKNRARSRSRPRQQPICVEINLTTAAMEQHALQQELLLQE